MNNEKYFTDIPIIGDLSLDKIFFEDVYPIFFSLISKEQKRYIGVCCELYGEQRWLISPISNSSLIQMLKNEISMREAFLTQNEEKCIIAHWSKDNPKLSYDFVDTCDLPECDLPLDEYLESEDDEFAEYIESLENSDNASYAVEFINKIQQISAKSLSSSIIYKPFKLISDIFQEEQFKEITYMCEYPLKRI